MNRPSRLSIVIAPGPWDPGQWRDVFLARADGRPVSVWPDDGDEAGAAPYVICAWKTDPRVFEVLPSPRAVFSLGAGVDHLQVPGLLRDVPVARIVDPDLTMRMVEYVTFAVLHLHRQISRYAQDQSLRVWAPRFQTAASRVRVGIMGLGVLGEACGRTLAQLGFDVAGWVRTPREATSVQVFAGQEALGAFLARTEILVNLLPNTPQTRGLIGADVFARLADGARFVNVGRGETVVEDELVQALASGRLAGAVLDVFGTEPLPADSPLWALPGVLITPHVAADSDPDVIADQIIRNIERLERGEALAGRVDMTRGY